MITYNEIDPFAAQWLRNLINAGQLPEGVVDERSIRDLRFLDVNGAVQFHAFAGIGVWAHALKNWPKEIPVWTGSCPCQPFSSAGKKKGFDDDRHLWPEWFRLIRACRPPIIFGEQVASPDGLKWFDAVSSDLEGAGYTVGAADLCAAGVGAPHLRQRLYFVAVSDMQRCEGIGLQLRERRSRSTLSETGRSGPLSVVADNASGGRGEGRQARGQDRAGPADASVMVDAEEIGRRSGRIGAAHGWATLEPDRHGATRGYWADAEWIYCRDDKYRPVEPGTFPLANGVTGRVGELRAYGNALVAPVAQTFVESVMDVLFGLRE